ncbi:hypothetical protein CC85DRAFT_23665 [Cutaneotrichosporon oleaginosum]|uniref:Uncharacterized protein n=1 Tax=Cutaneotrichosporon oleaginosum TaxID=879819 RepID=A0A0J1B8U3_9TREE|nr:uncharacterized protein CC85DRAFT_23665 [Cutaneotrichosporon oleaginosum]KLT44214.1 hypothetical protein CC85DRAFT_23665 [Cutaneotrichosporon oleaginosum]TXT11618.1 hypothetical protein COLE_02028 [Cutaneotrichosporon oleaginosum]
MTSTVAAPTRTHSYSAPARTSEVSLSSTTIVALGMGFIGAALFVVGLVVLIRVVVVTRAVRRERAQGQTSDFASMWQRYGGVWGLLFAPGQGMEWTPVRVRRRAVGPPPKMWDVDIAKLQPEDEFDMDKEETQPLAAAPYYAPGSNVPECAFSVLVVMPAPPHPLESDEEPSLPDLMLGTTHLQPTIPLAEAGLKSDDESDKRSEFEYVVNELDLMRARNRRELHWATVWGMDAGGRM